MRSDRAIVALLLAACASTASTPDPGSVTRVAPRAALAPAPAPENTPQGAAPHATTSAPEQNEPPPLPCGDFGCRLYASPGAAFAAVLADEPLVLAVGEMHALQGTEGIASATRRFTRELLPMLAGRATDLVLELWVADPDCKREVEKVEKAQGEITTGQATTNPNEFVALGNESKRLGIQPYVLEPSCEDYERIAAAGDDDVVRMLETIATLTTTKVAGLADKNRVRAPGKLIATYGGAIHNDLEPTAGAASFSFGPALSAHVGARYVALDLVVPELIRDTRLWRSQPWRAAYDANAHPTKTTLYHPRPGEYALIFPRAQAAASAPASP